MAIKKKIKKVNIPIIDDYKPELMRRKWKRLFQERFFKLFCGILDFGKYVTSEERIVILKLFWENGGFSVSRSPSPIEKYEEYMDLTFTKFAIDDYDYNLMPLHYHNTPLKSSKAVNEKPLEVGKSGVLVYFNEYTKTHPNYGVKQTAQRYIDQIVSAKMTINTNLLLHKLPFLVPCDEGSMETYKDVIRQIFSDVPVVFVPNSMQNSEPKGMQLNTPYIIDKVESYITTLENMFLDEIGVDNSKPVQSGQDRLLLDETNANNAKINNFRSGIFDTINEGFKDVETLFKRTIKVKPKKPKKQDVTSVHEDINDNDSGKEDDLE